MRLKLVSISCCYFIPRFDVVEFYPSITQDLSNDALDFAAKFARISDRDRQIIIHAKKTLLFHDDSHWNKFNPSHQFDVTIGSYDRTETCELLDSYILSKICDLFDGEVGLYRDDAWSSHPPQFYPMQKDTLSKNLWVIFIY